MFRAIKRALFKRKLIAQVKAEKQMYNLDQPAQKKPDLSHYGLYYVTKISLN